MTGPALDDALAEKLKDDRASLRSRFIAVPSLVTGRPDLIDGGCPPIKPLFEHCKQRRDSFVHCVPGRAPTRWGYVKEERFYDVESGAVNETVQLTYDAICLVWQAVHGSAKPSWLRKRNSDGRFGRMNATLQFLDA